jgi:hypothetical protein
MADVSPAIVTHLVQQWEARVAAIREREMRAAVLLEMLNEVTIEELVGCLALVVERSRNGVGQSRELLQELALDPGVLQQLTYDRLEAAYSYARDLGQEDIARMFLSNRPPWQDPLTPAAPENQALDLPLGLRRAAARTTDRLVLDRLMHDKNPLVVRLLLDNPRVVERDVVRMAAMRPTTIEILTMIAAHRRWGSEYRVRKAIVCNPFAPTDLKVRLLPTLMRQDLHDALREGALEAEARDAARRRLAAPDSEA